MDEAKLAQSDVFDETQLVTFLLAEEEFGIPISFVKEIVRVPDITRIPKVPSFIQGVANLRGSILPIVSLRNRFGLPAEERTEDNRVIVVEVSGKLIGLVVDQVREVLRVPNEWVEPPPPIIAGVVEMQYLRGVAKLKDGARLVTLLDVERAIPSENMIARPETNSRQALATEVQSRASREAIDGEQMVTFRLGGEEYAARVADVQEIIRVPDISRVPGAPAFVEGVVALRNRLLPIVNLRKRFELPAMELDDDSRIIVANMGGVVTGIQVDAVSEVLTVPNTAIEEPPQITSATKTHPLRGVAKLDEGKRLVMLLDISRTLSVSDVHELAKITGGANSEDGAGEPSVKQSLDEEQVVSFRVDKEEFGVDIHLVQEIIRLPEITKVPRTPHFVEGIVNLRSSVLPVIDMHKRFGLAPTPRTDSTSIVVVDIEGRKTGVIVDSVSEVLRVRRSAIEPPPPVVAGVDAGFVRGVGKLQDGQRMIIILDLARLVAVDEAA